MTNTNSAKCMCAEGFGMNLSCPACSTPEMVEVPDHDRRKRLRGRKVVLQIPAEPEPIAPECPTCGSADQADSGMCRDRFHQSVSDLINAQPLAGADVRRYLHSDAALAAEGRIYVLASDYDLAVGRQHYYRNEFHRIAEQLDSTRASLLEAQQERDRMQQGFNDACATIIDREQEVGRLTRENAAMQTGQQALTAELLGQCEQLTQRAEAAEADAARYREFWRDPINPLLDDLGLQIIRYGSCEGVFNKSWCDQQLDSAIAAGENGK